MLMQVKRAAVVALVGVLMAAWPMQQTPSLATLAQEDARGARNVVLFLGDGLGGAQRLAGQLATIGSNERLRMDALPYGGLVDTVPADPDSVVSDSAAAATAYATGMKTANNRAGTDADGNSLVSILELARDAGMATGIVTTSAVVDASLAGFAAHVADRDDTGEIARQLIQETRPDVILGGGEDYFYPAGNPGIFPDDPDPDAESMSVGSRDLIAEADAAGYQYVTDAQQLADAAGPRVLGLFANEGLAFQPDGAGGVTYSPTISLAEMTAKAIAILSQNPNGFFLLVEEDAGLDTVAHDNEAEILFQGVAALDAAVGIAADFAAQNGETLVIVTADHETGGLIIEALDDPDEPDESGVEADDSSGISGEDGPFTVAGEERQFMLDWTTADHTGAPVPLTAMGPGAESFTGIFPNTAVFTVMVDTLRLSSAAMPGATAAATPTD